MIRLLIHAFTKRKQGNRYLIADAGRTWIVAQVNNKAFNSPVLCHVEGINDGPSALRAEVVQAQVADGRAVRQAYQCLHACQDTFNGHVNTERGRPLDSDDQAANLGFTLASRPGW